MKANVQAQNENYCETARWVEVSAQLRDTYENASAVKDELLSHLICMAILHCEQKVIAAKEAT